MPRGDQVVAEGLLSTWVVEVDDYNRIRLPLNVRAIVRWIELKGKQECIGIPGSRGGIQVAPLTEHQEHVRRLAEAIADKPPSASESPRDWVEVARLLATAWPVTVHVEATRISITLPEPPRRAQQVPPAGGIVVVFGFGDILEIWDAVKWHDHIRGPARRKAAALSEALEALEQR